MAYSVYAVSVPVKIDKLERELSAAIGTKLNTIRQTSNPDDFGVYPSCEIVHEGADTSTLASVVSAHQPIDTLEQQLHTGDINTLIGLLESGSATAGQTQRGLALVFKLLRRLVTRRLM